MNSSPLDWSALRPAWLESALATLDAPLEQQPWLRPVLERFFEALIKAAQTARTEALETFLQDWVAHSPDLTLGPDANPEDTAAFSIFRVVVCLQQATHKAIAQTWQGVQAIVAQEKMLPIWARLLPLAAQMEMEERLERINQRWQEVQQEKEQLHQAKLTFISVAAHELRTPLTVIEGYAAILRESLKPNDDPQLLEPLEGILRGAARMRDIVNDLVDISLIHANLLELAFQPLWLNRLFHSLALEFAPILEERHLALEIRDFPGSDILLYGDPDRLRQAFHHLLSNAVKYTPDGGKITVDGRLLPGFVEVTISDTGIGIAPENQEYIFDFFARVGDPLTHSTGKTKFKGAGPGLGLPMTKGIIEAHGGTIWVESPGYDEARCPGSTFHVLLPVYETPPDTEPPHLEVYRQLANTLRPRREDHAYSTR